MALMPDDMSIGLVGKVGPWGQGPTFPVSHPQGPASQKRPYEREPRRAPLETLMSRRAYFASAAWAAARRATGTR